jgi:hypothetical protein
VPGVVSQEVGSRVTGEPTGATPWASSFTPQSTSVAGRSRATSGSAESGLASSRP